MFGMQTSADMNEVLERMSGTKHEADSRGDKSPHRVAKEAHDRRVLREKTLRLVTNVHERPSASTATVFETPLSSATVCSSSAPCSCHQARARSESQGSKAQASRLCLSSSAL